MSKNKKPRLVTVENFLESKMDIFTKSIAKDGLKPEPTLNAILELLEDDMDDDFKSQLKTICIKKLEENEKKISSLKTSTTTHYHTCSVGEKRWYEHLSSRSPQLAEVKDSHGNVCPAHPSSYILNDDDLEFLYLDMNARVTAIQYEKARRAQEAENITFKYIAKKYEPVVLESYTQSIDDGFQ